MINNWAYVVMQSIQNVPKKTTKVKAELIDVDLVRGKSHGHLPRSRTLVCTTVYLTNEHLQRQPICASPFNCKH